MSLDSTTPRPHGSTTASDAPSERSASSSPATETTAATISPPSKEGTDPQITISNDINDERQHTTKPQTKRDDFNKTDTPRVDSCPVSGTAEDNSLANNENRTSRTDETRNAETSHRPVGPPPPDRGEKDDHDGNRDEEERFVLRAYEFLSHPSITNLSEESKEEYLLSKGVTRAQVQIAKRRLRTGRDTGDGNGSQMRAGRDRRHDSASGGGYGPPRGDSGGVDLDGRGLSRYDRNSGGRRGREEGDSMSAVVVPLGMGAVIALLGMAAWRWINGGDFVIFPDPLIQPRASISDSNTSLEVEEEEEDEENSSCNSEDSEEEEEYDNFIDQNGGNKETVPPCIQLLADKIDALTNTLENFVEKQKKDQARTFTNSAMDLLRQGGETTTNDTKSTGTTHTDDAKTAASQVSYPTIVQEYIQSLLALNKNTPKAVLLSSLQSLHLYTLNLSKNFQTPRYRKIFISNASYKTIQESLHDNSGEAFLLNVGFKKKDNCLEYGGQELDLVVEAARALASVIRDLRVPSSFDGEHPNAYNGAGVAKNAMVLAHDPFRTPNTKDDMLISPPLRNKVVVEGGDLLPMVLPSLQTPIVTRNQEQQGSMSLKNEGGETTDNDTSIRRNDSYVSLFGDNDDNGTTNPTLRHTFENDEVK